AGDLVEHHPLDGRAVTLFDAFRNVPGDRLALAIGVCGEVDARCDLRGALELRERLFLTGYRDVGRLEAMRHVYSEPLGGQVTHVTHGGPHSVVGAQILADRFRLRGRFHDHQRLSGAVAELLGCGGHDAAAAVPAPRGARGRGLPAGGTARLGARGSALPRRG